MDAVLASFRTPEEFFDVLGDGDDGGGDRTESVVRPRRTSGVPSDESAADWAKRYWEEHCPPGHLREQFTKSIGAGGQAEYYYWEIDPRGTPRGPRDPSEEFNLDERIGELFLESEIQRGDDPVCDGSSGPRSSEGAD